MARCPFAQQRILPENATQRAITPRAVILHTAVDGPGDTDLAAYFGQSSVKAESHFYVTRRGDIVQMMDTTVEADANGTADRWAISIETEDDSARRGADILPWNPDQLDALVRLVTWCCDTHGIPKARCTSAKLPGAAGIGCHSQPMRERFDGTRHNPWTAYQGKTCPGDARWAQYPEIVARVAGTTTAPPEPAKEWDEMATKAEIADAVRGVVEEEVGLAVMAITGDQFDIGTIRDADVFNHRDVEAAIKGGVLAVGVQVIQQVGQAQGVNVNAAEVAEAITDELARRLA